MNLILDSNILFSAIIRNSITRYIILKCPETFLLSSFVIDEINEHKEHIKEKAKISELELNNILNTILKKVTIVSKEDTLIHAKLAFEVIKDIDVDDLPFISCALLYNNSILWSDDKALKKQNAVNVFNTKEIIVLLNLTHK